MKNPNGYGSIKKLSGKRRKPFAVYVTTGFNMCHKFPKIDFLEQILTPELYSQVKAEYNAYISRQPQHAVQQQTCIGYFATRQEAMITLAEYNRNPYDADHQSITFEEAYDAVYRDEIAKKRTRAQRVYLDAYKKCSSLYKRKMRDIRLPELQEIVDQYSSASRSTQNGMVLLFHCVFSYCIKYDILQRDYSQHITINNTSTVKQKVPFSKKEISAIWQGRDWIQSAAKSLKGVPLVDTILIMIYTGMRIGELLALKVEDVHLSDRWIEVHGTKTKAAERIVPIHKDLIPVFKEHIDGRTIMSETVFTDNRNNPIDYHMYLSVFFKRFLQHFTMSHTIHECRHTFATLAAKSEMNSLLVKKIIGHASNNLTEDVYTHVYIDSLVNEIDKLSID